MMTKCTSCGAWNRVKREEGKNPLCGKCKRALSALPLIQDLDEAGFDTVLKESQHPLLVDFWATWCGPCRMVAPLLEKFAGRHSGVQLFKVDIDRNPHTADRFHVEAVPTLILFSGGEERQRVSGVLSVNELETVFGSWLPPEN